ncbi:helix-turn-helix transcriptional regulator [Zhenhengia yiwuensis]|uniref:Helix-turn-helix transcriptional regulator n=1 Tax=Zhenhengia yiwuensis TaxID=2763666 RepID=A0A926EKP0_9FIRM|nr:helix-turn-helix transcriptional regulator [Zhenhengia yiwuensis]MBC8580107.1 helix-turn-helix transcriptional regulator [Zhenhengia yiwuensis]
MNNELLKKARNQANLTQKEVAEKLGIATKTYNRKELGVIDFTRKEILKLIHILNLSAKEFNKIFLNEQLPIGND